MSQKAVHGPLREGKSLCCEVTAIVLSGGTARRLGAVGHLLPKALLAISSTETLMSRLFDQLIEAGIGSIVVSTSPRQAALLSAFVDNYIRYRHECEPCPGSVAINIFENSFHQDGPIPALNAALQKHPSSSYLLCLSDIFFARNPYLDMPKDGSNILFAGDHQVGRGGVITRLSGGAIELSYSAVRQSSSDAYVRFNWSGSARFQAAIASEMSRFHGTLSSDPLEDLFNYAINNGARFSVLDIGMFVNVNDFSQLETCQRIALQNA